MKKSIFIIFIYVSFSSIFGQTTLKKDNSFTYNNFPQEKIFVHFNSTLLISGEELFYKIYCLNTNTNKLSSLSKIAYVELINTDKNTIFKHKILLKSGLGEGYFFIKTSIPSGNYKLIAYTQWMRNGGVNTFFQNDITIINPFRANKKLTVNQSEHQNTIKSQNNLFKKHVKILENPVKNDFVELCSNKKTFLKREKVVLTIKSTKGKFSYGNYSVSVKKIDSIDTSKRHSSSSFTSNNNLKASPKDSIFYMPELRGEILSGTVFIKESNTPISSAKISFSIPGENSIFKIATTNKSGVFYFNLDKEYKNTNAIIQVIGSKKDEYSVVLKKYKSPNYNDFEFYDFKLTSELKGLILNKSILSQIENAYHSVKKNSILPTNSMIPSYKYKEKQYFLDDYTRFKTLNETITEVVGSIYVLRKKGDYTFHIKHYNEASKSDLLPLVLIDGILIQNHNSIIDYNAKNIKSIGVVRDKYIYGGQSYMGVISIKTLDGDYNSSFKEWEYMKSIELDKPLVGIKYFKQTYSDNFNLNRIPDFRSQLLWSPNLTLRADENIISFYTSDNTGDYEICIEGFTNSGKPVSLREIIKVKG
ncbi:MAG: hypothetical protein V3U92_12285 [Cellulophaga sp.]